MLSNAGTYAIVNTNESFKDVFLNWLKSDEEELTVTWNPSTYMSHTKNMEFNKVFQYIPSHPEVVIILQYGTCEGGAFGFFNKSTEQFLLCRPAYISLLKDPIPTEFVIIDDIQEELEKKVTELLLLENKESFEKEMTDIRGGRGLSHFNQMEWRWLNLSDTYDEQKSLLFHLKDYGPFNIGFHHILAYWLGDTSVVHDAKEYYEKAANKASFSEAIRAFCEEKFCREEYEPSMMALQAKRWADAIKKFVQEKEKAGKNIVKLRVRTCDSDGNVNIRYVPWERLADPWEFYHMWEGNTCNEEIDSISYGKKVIVGSRWELR